MPRSSFLANWLTSRVATRMIAVSNAVGEALVRRGTPRSKLAVIPNGVVTDRLDIPVPEQALESWRTRISWEPSHRTIGVVARHKDQAVVLRALAEVGSPVRLVLAGLEPTGELGRLATRVPERHRVVFIAYDSDVRPLYDLLELVLLPSRSEGLSQGLLEAMALGKPVIASAATGNLEVVTHGRDGLLVDPRSPSAWASAIQRLLADPPAAQRMGMAARIAVRDKFSLSLTIQRTIELYRLILGA
jgi:glycosyltransferase involved in cell wall biosynthesis